MINVGWGARNHNLALVKDTSRRNEIVTMKYINIQR